MRSKGRDSLNLLLILLVLCLTCTITCAEFSGVSSDTLANGAGIVFMSKSSGETSNDLGPGWYTGTQNLYQHWGTTSRVVSSGPTGMKRSENLEGPRTEYQQMAVVSTGKINIHESGGTSSTQSNISPTQCDSGGALDESDGRYPETQSSTVFSDLYGTGETTSYESEYLADEKRLAADVSYDAADDSVAFWDASGKFEAGLDYNSTILQYVYSRAERAFIRAMNDTPINATASWDWDMSADEVAEETAANETVSNVTEAAEETIEEQS